MSYIEQIVGLSGTTDPAPQAGVRLVNTLPIISDSFAIAISKLDDASPINDVWNRTIENAEAKLNIDLYSELMKDLKFRQMMARTTNFGYSSGAGRVQTARWEGARFRANKQENTKLSIRQIYVSGTGSFTWKIFDLTTNTVLFQSSTATVITGEGYIDIKKDIALSKLQNDILVAVDCTNIDLNPIDGNKGFFSDNCGGYPVSVSSGSISLTDSIISSNFIASNCYVHVTAEISSDMNSVIEQNVDLFRECAWHLCGHLLLSESLSTDKFNWWTNTNRVVRSEEADRQYNEYHEYLCKLVQPILMRLNTTNVVEDKDVTEKLGIHTASLLDYYPSEYYIGQFGVLNSQDYPMY